MDISYRQKRNWQGGKKRPLLPVRCYNNRICFRISFSQAFLSTRFFLSEIICMKRSYVFSTHFFLLRDFFGHHHGMVVSWRLRSAALSRQGEMREERATFKVSAWH